MIFFNILTHSIAWGSLVFLFTRKYITARWTSTLIVFSIFTIFLCYSRLFHISFALFHQWSIPFILLLIDFLSPKALFSKTEKHQFFLLSFIVGIFFFSLASGFTHINPYIWGSDNPLSLFILFAIQTVALKLNNKLILISITLSLFGCSLQIYSTTNIWNYLIDPGLFCCATYIMLKTTLRNQYEKLTTSD